MSLKSQTHFNTIHNIQVISPHWLPPPQRLACLRARTTLQMRLQHCPPISVLTTPYAFTPRPYHPYACVVPSQHASSTASVTGALMEARGPGTQESRAHLEGSKR
ncbi:hypothetical protein O181_117235 [Austropuccinia psidii MF-1]|uniref:Uncharacterized protein n=1 Tax=Austropuccinia psidii MF-1 TaxID=1389203 RepID=A0A9Q3PY77_9BASI|nr:hypothetical protein [Austropuccinia psidii MF-1]